MSKTPKTKTREEGEHTKMQKELPPKAQKRLRQIERWRDGHQGQIREIHAANSELRLQKENLEAEKRNASADVAVEIDREIDRIDKRLAANAEAYAELGQKGARLNALKETCEKYLSDHGFLLLDEANPRKPRAPIFQRTTMDPQKNSGDQQRAERLREKGWR